VTDAFDLPPHIRQILLDAAKALAPLSTEPPPPAIVEALRIFQERLEGVRAAIDQMAASNSVAGVLARQQAAMAQIAASFATTHQVPVPTAEELAEADKRLRTQVLPETSEEELEKAVAGIADDPEKVKLAAFLTNLVEQATGVPGSAPWVVFLLVFCIAVKVDPDVVGALAFAYVIMQDVRRDK
jgi:hypothetical protein